MTIALFGGSFNPPHVAHQLVALYVLETCAIDELWFVPTFTHAFGKPLAPFSDRVAMCELATAPLGPRVRVMRVEEEVAARPDLVAGRTLDLLTYLGEVRPEARFRLVIGADILAEAAKWHRWADVVAKAPPIVVGRPGYPSQGLELVDISATRVRALAKHLTLAERGTLASGQDAAPELATLLPRAVLWYIARSGLYT
jgi:nicotinate-nucleotide adenylyltransferase